MAAKLLTWTSRTRQFSRCISPLTVLTRSYNPKPANPRAYNRIKLSVPREPKKKDDSPVYLMTYQSAPQHTFTEALQVLRAYAISNFDQTVELHLRIDMGLKRTKMQAFHGMVLLPRPYGKTRSILVFAEGELAETAKKAGANIVGGKELVEKVKNGFSKFDQCLSTLDMLDSLKPLQKTLKQKMPTTRRGSATDDIALAIKSFRQSHPYKCDSNGILNVGVAKLSFDDSEIKNNCMAVIQAVHGHRLSNKGTFIKSLMLSSTHGPGLMLHPDELMP